MFDIPVNPPLLNTLISTVTSPSQIDSACTNAGSPARLMNFDLATLMDLSDFGLGQCTYIPVLVSAREGGRKSLYYLENNEEALAGLIINQYGFAKRYVKRISGTNVPASDGDQYQERWVNYNNDLIWKGTGSLDIIDFSIGKGEISYTATQDSPINVNGSFRWVLWSCFCWGSWK